MRQFLALFAFVLLLGTASAQPPTVVPGNGFRDAIMVRMQQIAPSVRVERRDELGIAVGDAQTIVTLDTAYGEYARNPGTLGILIERYAREALAAGRQAAAAAPRQSSTPRSMQTPGLPQQRLPRQRLPEGIPAVPLELKEENAAPAPPSSQPDAQRRRLTVIVLTRNALAQMSDAAAPPVSRPFLGDLVQVLSLDDVMVPASRLGELGLATDEAWTLAVENLRRMRSRSAVAPIEPYEHVVRLSALGGVVFLTSQACGPTDQGNRLFLMLSRDSFATADRRAPGAEAAFFRFVRHVTQSGQAFSQTPVTCRAGAWEIARPRV